MKMNLDLSGVVVNQSPMVDFIPAGSYVVSFVKFEIMENKQKTGQNLNCFMRVEDGPQAGKTLRDTLCIVHNNTETQRIALQKLKSIAIAAQLKNPNHISDSDEMLGKTVEVEVAEGTYESDGRTKNKNIIKWYNKAQDVFAKAIQPAAPAAAVVGGSEQAKKYPWS